MKLKIQFKLKIKGQEAIVEGGTAEIKENYSIFDIGPIIDSTIKEHYSQIEDIDEMERLDISVTKIK